ncbi:MAG: DNA repair and recombination protein RadB [Candidatus Nanoarchaeia archaeon]
MGLEIINDRTTEIKKENYELDRLMTGSYDLNKFFEGGYDKDILTLFYGPPGSGKTNFVLLAAAHEAKKGGKVIFIDSEGGFSIERIKQISGGIPEFILKNIFILKPTDFKEQKKSFSKLLNELKSKNVTLIVVDSITMLYRLELAEARSKGVGEIQKVNLEFSEQVKTLFEIARKKNIPVLITSQVYNEFLSDADWASGKEAKLNVVGGDLLKYWCKCIVELENNYGKKRAVLRKHRSIPERELNFEIINEGIRKRGWI